MTEFSQSSGVELEVVLGHSSEDRFGVSLGRCALNLELERCRVERPPEAVESVSSFEAVQREEGPDLLGGGVAAAAQRERREEGQSKKVVPLRLAVGIL